MGFVAFTALLVYGMLMLTMGRKHRCSQRGGIHQEGLSDPEVWSFVDGQLVPRRIGMEAFLVGPSKENTKTVPIPMASRDLVRSGFCTRWSHGLPGVDVYQIEVSEDGNEATIRRDDVATGWAVDLHTAHHGMIAMSAALVSCNGPYKRSSPCMLVGHPRGRSKWSYRSIA